MAYTHGKNQYILLGTGATQQERISINSTALYGDWQAGRNPFLVRAVTVINTATIATSGYVVSFRDELVGSTSATGNQFASITVACGATHRVYCNQSFTPQRIDPGYRVRMVCTAAATGEAVIATVWGDWINENPASATAFVGTVTA